jgi:predicted nucleic acid-binding protein
MKLYFDTSALVKFFHVEEGTPVVSGLVEDGENQIYISELAKIEFHCALYRRCRNGELESQKLEQALDGFNNQIDAFNIERLGSAVVDEAEKLLQLYGRHHGLRTLDALHLATFSLISERNWHFVSTDSGLNKVANKMGFEVINPLGSND